MAMSDDFLPDEELDLDDAEQHMAHYTFAHNFLRDLAHHAPLDFIQIMERPEAKQFLKDLFEQMWPKEIDLNGFSVDDIAIHPILIGDFRCAVIEMPEPKSDAGAYFAAALVLNTPEQMKLKWRKPRLRFLTLEKGIDLGFGSATVLGEWTSKGAHTNYGTGPEPTLDAFVETLKTEFCKPTDQGTLWSRFKSFLPGN